MVTLRETAGGTFWSQSNEFDFGYVVFEMPVTRYTWEYLWAIRKIREFKRGGRSWIYINIYHVDR